MPNKLAEQTSPYLLQHADNPVDWWPWCPEAFAEATRRGVPVLLSVGYASCHWCHVMAHESFEDVVTAAYMNDHFVSIKVDREERPDVDSVYMDVTVALTGHGGWPMTVFLTPTAEPFFAGTYFPPRPRPGMGSFRQVMEAVTAAWQTRRAEIEESGADIARRLAEAAARGPVAGLASSPTSGVADELTPQLLDTAVAGLSARFDARHGGFGGAPKFPPSMVAEMLLRHAARTGDEQSLQMVAFTCERMARGGMYDQLAGGFARYSVDATWTVPHFEKMLYDNAQLLRVYLHLWRATGAPLAERVVRETAAFLLADLRTPQGGFASALDADAVPAGVAAAHAQPEEGASYSWTPAGLRAVLGAQDGDWAAEIFGVTAEGTFEHGTSVLQLPADPPDAARCAGVRAALAAARATRPQPARDDKVVAAWNGLAIAALAEAGALLDEPAWISAAEDAAVLLRDVHLVAGRLRRTSRDGRVGTNAGVLEDYGDVAEGLLTLHQVTGDPQWLTLAGELLDVVRARFAAPDGGFFDTADDAEALLRRPRDDSDSATPSGQAAVAGALLTYAALTASAEHRATAEQTVARFAPLLSRDARFAGWAGAVAEALLAGPAEVAVVDSPALERLARLGTAPGAVVVTSGPLVAGRGAPGVYVCRDFVCELPVHSAEEVRRQLGVKIAT
ncbi:thioredoxin domain-containing protein [Frankia gtarii]|uniref:thioredoxin domain-containing protein n=1 Tax=Frankia gtarii TaxID=2950102 RepID=UPI0021BFD4D0|nr:thioredoxin domain-containing protein [Frankia gtarii]